MIKPKFIVFLYLITLFLSGRGEGASSSLDCVERRFLSDSQRMVKYPGENISVVVANNLCSLGKMAALHFINWIIFNPEGVVALAFDKQEYFIKYLHYYKKNWKKPAVRKELNKYGIYNEDFPDTSKLKFVQINEFFPTDTTTKSSLTYLVNKYYIKFLDLKSENILTMGDTFVPILKKYGIETIFVNNAVSLKILATEPVTYKDNLQQGALQEIFSFCENYEKKIKQWGGIGFFLCGLGSDGQIGFNQKGSWHNNQTRLVKLYNKKNDTKNGLDKYAITIGLNTICLNKKAEIIITATEDNTNYDVTNVIESPVSLDHPATAFHKMAKTKFYLTRGIEKHLTHRKHLDFVNQKELPNFFIENTLVEVSLLKKKPIFALTAKDMTSTPAGNFLIGRLKNSFKEVKLKTQKMIIQKTENQIALKEPATILHISHFPGDVFLAYYPLANRLIGHYENVFCSIDSDAKSISHAFLKKCLDEIKEEAKGHFENTSSDYNTLFSQLKKAYFSKSFDLLNNIQNSLISKKLVEIYKSSSLSEFLMSLDKITKEISSSEGSFSLLPIKEALRELEEEKSWYLSNSPLYNIIHLRLPFNPKEEDLSSPFDKTEIKKMSKTIEKINPTIVSLPFSQEEIGPVGYHQNLKLISSALSTLNKPNMLVWGYLATAYDFNLDESNLFYLVSQEEFDNFNALYSHCYLSQIENGSSSPNFMELAGKQLLKLKILLGDNFFKKHPNKRIKNAKGLILVKEMSLQDFLKIAKTQTANSEENNKDLHSL